jgi:hypothetical protein
MGDPAPIYRQPAEPQLTSSDQEVVAAFRSSGMSRVGQWQLIGNVPAHVCFVPE